MTAVELENNFKKFSEDLQGDAMAKIMVNIGSEARFYIYDRITKTGTNSKGEKYKSPGYGGYSTKSMLSGCKGFVNESKCPAISKEKRKALKWVTIERKGKNYRLYEIPGGYKEFKRLNGYTSEFVDFKFRNDMWPDITIIHDIMAARQGQITISTLHDEQQRKLKWNTAKFGDILMVNKTEEQKLADYMNEELEKLIVNNGLK